MEYLLGHPAAEVDEKAFEQASGVGVIVSPEEIESGVYWFAIYCWQQIMPYVCQFSRGVTFDDADGVLSNSFVIVYYGLVVSCNYFRLKIL